MNLKDLYFPKTGKTYDRIVALAYIAESTLTIRLIHQRKNKFRSKHRKRVSFSVNLSIRTYGLSDRFCLLGIHPNTVRLYEKLKLIPKPERLSNGYRVFTDFVFYAALLAPIILLNIETLHVSSY